MTDRKRHLEGIGMTSRRTRERMIRQLQEMGITDQSVLDVMCQVPRHMFIDEALSHKAYDHTALPIGLSQTISQPYIVARMTELLLKGKLPARVLEIGTGSGYQTAVLAHLVRQVFSVERIRTLQSQARGRLAELGLRNIRFNHADGEAGWAAHAPYDAIMVTAAGREIPENLLNQLAEGGVMLIPVDDESGQSLKMITRSAAGFAVETIEAVTFVPLLSGVI